MNNTEVAIMLTWGKMVNPNTQPDRDTYYSILFALNELEV